MTEASISVKLWRGLLAIAVFLILFGGLMSGYGIFMLLSTLAG
jgi:hypothetical protein